MPAIVLLAVVAPLVVPVTVTEEYGDYGGGGDPATTS